MKRLLIALLLLFMCIGCCSCQSTPPNKSEWTPLANNSMLEYVVVEINGHQILVVKYLGVSTNCIDVTPEKESGWYNGQLEASDSDTQRPQNEAR